MNALLDEEIYIQVSPHGGHHAVVCLLENILESITQKDFAIAYFNISIKASDCDFKLNLPALTQSRWQDQIPHFEAEEFSLFLNACIQAPMRLLREIIAESIEILCWTKGAICQERRTTQNEME